MRTCLWVAFLLLLIPCAGAQGADMKVHLKSGSTVTIPGSDVRRIEFAHVTLGVIDPSGSGRVSGPIQLLGSYPNPFRPSTTIEFQVAARTDIRVRIFDLKGALVRELMNENVAAGRHQVTWDGTDRNRSRVSSGVYFYNVECGTAARSGRLVLVK